MATTPQLVLTALQAAGIPVLSVSCPVEADRATWTLAFDPSVTADQQAQAVAIMASVGTDTMALHAQDQKDVKAYLDAMSLVERAIDLTILDQVNFIRSKLPTPLGAITPAQWVAAVKAKVDAL